MIAAVVYTGHFVKRAWYQSVRLLVWMTVLTEINVDIFRVIYNITDF